MQKGHVQITPVAGLEGVLSDAVAEVELVVLERGEDARPIRHHLMAFVVADRQHVGNG